MREFYNLHRLSPREKEVALLVSLGHNVRAIAKILGVSDTTVKAHLHNIYSELGFSVNKSERDTNHLAKLAGLVGREKLLQEEAAKLEPEQKGIDDKMLIVEVKQIHPLGAQLDIGHVEIINDGTGGPLVGHYDVLFFDKRKGLIRKIRIEDWPRQEKNAYDLVAEAWRRFHEYKRVEGDKQ